MKKLLFALLLLLSMGGSVSAAHIKGGFFTYQYLGPGSGTNLRYRITLTVYMICNPNSGQLSNPINFTIFNGASNQQVTNVSVPITTQYTLSKVYDEPCITGNEVGCYYLIVVYDLPTIELPAIPEGYTVAYQRCCRIAGINNLTNSSAVGNTFTIRIPGSATGQNAQINSSPQFLVNDTAVVCRGSYFQTSFAATDTDGDSLSYQFCGAYQGGDAQAPSPNPAANPPYTEVPYAVPYTGTQPLGSAVTINPTTGMISGIAPDMMGQYVICVCVNEYRNGVLINTTRKELHIAVNDCNPLRAQLNPRPAFCESLDVSFSNDAAGNPPNAEYLWNFGDPASGNNNTSTQAVTNHIFSAPGDYTVKLRVTLLGVCSDSTTTVVRVWPGFFPGFTISGVCVLNPFQFTDTTSANYGVVDNWRWNFGDNATLADTSRIRNPAWTYSAPGNVNVSLIVSTSKGCTDTITKVLNVLDKPLINLAFRDTLICQYDSLSLQAAGSGNFSWTPLVNMVNPNTPSPRVAPMTTTWYYVNLNNNGCINKDSVRVRVTQGVLIIPMGDTTICQGDTIQLRINSNALQHSWTPGSSLNDPTTMSPLAVTNTLTTYQVTGSIGSCSSTKQITVTPIPYPIARLSADTLICFNTPAFIRASSNGRSFLWQPTTYLSNPLSLTPIARPPTTQRYILSVFDNRGCPKPGIDTVVVTVRPEVIANAGRDTTVVVGQSLQLNATGGVYYDWSPATGLSSTAISNPIALYRTPFTSIRYRMIASDSIGCPDTAFLTVRVFQTAPSVFVPTGFTPNGDGLNDIIKPVLAGIKKLNYFRIFNRWGQLVYETQQEGQGWDGRINGQLQGTHVFVWTVSAVDYLDQPYFAKGTLTLIR
jgi:gliding motility-associated-like protein